jgi:hypothetical protein
MYALLLHEDKMQARPELSTAPQFQYSEKVSVVTKGLFLRGQLDRKLNAIKLGAE